MVLNNQSVHFILFQIGDYILTPDICVERKSISDLIGSLNSGRLYTQCVQMTRYYKKSILLIEFDQNKPFHLQGHYMISSEGSSSNVDITQKLQLLTIHFPKLRLVWSPSPYATAQLFDELKQGRPEPIPEQAVALGSDETTKELDNIVDKLNTGIYDFLLKLPGITTRNVGKVMTKVTNMKELIKMNEVRCSLSIEIYLYDELFAILHSQTELAELLGSEANGKMLWEIFHKVHKPVEGEANEKQFMSKFKRGKGRRF